MQQKAVAVVPPSPSNSSLCWNCKVARPTPQESSAFCSECGKIQDYPIQELNYFKIFSLSEALILDTTALQRTFFELSKKLHPDCFTTQKHPEPQYALRWTMALNRAYQTLRNDDLRAEYILENYPAQKNTQSSVPVDLAETYFELQEASVLEKLASFKTELNNELLVCKSEWETIGAAFTHSDKSALVMRLKTLMDRKRYINSMLNDIDRKLEK